MLIAGRVIAGLAVGVLLSIVPVYNAELAVPQQRGVIVGLFAVPTGLDMAVNFHMAMRNGESHLGAKSLPRSCFALAGSSFQSLLVGVSFAGPLLTNVDIQTLI
jgi:hypothetical protein